MGSFVHSGGSELRGGMCLGWVCDVREEELWLMRLDGSVDGVWLLSGLEDGRPSVWVVGTCRWGYWFVGVVA